MIKKILATLGILVFAFFIWPTPYSTPFGYVTKDSANVVRYNRITQGMDCYWWSDGVWRPWKKPSEKSNPATQKSAKNTNLAETTKQPDGSEKFQGKILIVGSNLDPFDKPNSERRWWLEEVKKIDPELVIITSEELTQKDNKWISQFKIIFIPSDQPQKEYDSLNKNQKLLTEYLQNGGVISFSVAGMGWKKGFPTKGFNINNNKVEFIPCFEEEAVFLDSSKWPKETGHKSIFAKVATHAKVNLHDQNAKVLCTIKKGDPVVAEIKVSGGTLIFNGLSMESPNNTREGDPQKWKKLFQDYLRYLTTIVP